MRTPIYDFVKKYGTGGTLRLHMPGHKGKSFLGPEKFDITEISGADSLYEASGIISESEKNASIIFGAKTFYTTEGSSHAIRAMLYLSMLYSKEQSKKFRVAAARNVHRAFISAAFMLDIDVLWIESDGCDYLSTKISEQSIRKLFIDKDSAPSAVYITSPDYLGKISDIKLIAEICHENDALLIVDNAHGAYLKFLNESAHPIDLGADMCCDSAHKTLPALTGAAYLHISNSAPLLLSERAKFALSIFGSTSPSYLTLSSLDLLNEYLSDSYCEKLHAFILAAENAKEKIKRHGYTLFGNEPLKITIAAKEFGYTATDLSDILRLKNIEAEFSDSDYVVFMLSPDDEDALIKLTEMLLSIPMREKISDTPPYPSIPKKKLSIRAAMLSEFETLPLEKAHGRILALTETGCPPAVPITVSGEVIDEGAIECFKYYNINTVTVVK